MSDPDFQNSANPAQNRNVTVFPDRRTPSEAEVLTALMERLMERMDDFDRKLTAHAATESETVRTAVSAAMNACLPGGDADGHRRAHEAWIRKAEESAKFWQEMRLAAAKWAGLGLLAFLVVAAWHELLRGPK